MLQEVIDRLAGEVSALRMIAGAAEFAAASGQGVPQSPAAYVVPLEETAGASRLVGATGQTMRARFGVLVAYRHVGDARGESASKALEALGDAVRDALLGWPPSPAPVDAVAAKAEPNVLLGTLILTPTIAAAIAAAIDPTVPVAEALAAFAVREIRIRPAVAGALTSMPALLIGKTRVVETVLGAVEVHGAVEVQAVPLTPNLGGKVLLN